MSVLDTEGEKWDMKLSVKRSEAGNVARYIAGISQWMRAWGAREGDAISFEATCLHPLAVCPHQMHSPPARCPAAACYFP